jgi:hypothetical protein
MIPDCGSVNPATENQSLISKLLMLVQAGRLDRGILRSNRGMKCQLRAFAFLYSPDRVDRQPQECRAFRLSLNGDSAQNTRIVKIVRT